METFLFTIGGYLIGSLPFAFLLVRSRTGVDLRNSGSGNIGARNAYEVTENKQLGILVLILDMLKGIVPLVVLAQLHYCHVIPIGAVTIVLGHCYPVWLKFHGGRGLATAAGIAILTSPDTLLCWIIVYFLSGLVKKQVHLQSTIATIMSIFFALFAYGSPWFYNIRFICPGEKDVFQNSTIAILGLILTRHIQPTYEFIQKSKA